MRADRNGIMFHHGETLRGVSQEDLLDLIAFVEADTREQVAARIEGEKLKEGDLNLRRGPCGIGTWQETSPMGYTMRDLARCIRLGRIELDKNPVSPAEVYRKNTAGESLSAEDIDFGIEYFTRLSEMLRKAGPAFSVMASECSRVAAALMSYQPSDSTGV